MDTQIAEQKRWDTAKVRRARLTGIALMCATLACFSLLDSSAKYLSHYMPVLEIVWARYTSAFLLALLLFNPLARPGMMRTNRPWLQIIRSTLLMGSTIFNFLALEYLQLDQVLAVTFSLPFLVAALSGPMLGEWVGTRRWAAIGVGFVGVLVVTRPGFGVIHPAIGYAAAATLCYALYALSTRMLARTDSSETTLFYSNLVGAVVTLPIVYVVWTPPARVLEVVLMIAMGALGSFGHYLLIVAHRLAPASVLAPFIYTQLLWVVILGYLVFSDVPNGWTMVGIAIVIASGLYIFHRERVRGGP